MTKLCKMFCLLAQPQLSHTLSQDEVPYQFSGHCIVSADYVITTLEPLILALSELKEAALFTVTMCSKWKYKKKKNPDKNNQKID